MRRPCFVLLLMLAVSLVSATHAFARLDEYKFVATTGKRILIKKAPQVEFVYGQNPSDDGASNPMDIGFTFYFNGSAYTQFSVSSNGLIGLGDGQLTSCWVNQLNTPAGDCPGNGDDVYDFSLKRTPYISAFWDDLTVYNGINVFGNVTYVVTGKEPERILLIDFNDVETWYGQAQVSTWQVRLYEGSNKIEFFYQFLNPTYKGDGASIGLSSSESDFLSVTPGKGGSAVARSEKPDDFYNPNNIPIPEGTLYIFNPCGLTGTGDHSHNESRTLRNGDTLLLHKMAPIGVPTEFTPLELNLSGPNPCMGTAPFDMYLEGDGYSIDSKGGEISGGKPYMPTITFTAPGIGPSIGIITIVDDAGGKSYYYLAAEGGTRLEFIGHLDQGGTEKMEEGDKLMSNIHVRRGGSGSFRPFTISNNSKDPKAPPARVSFTLQGKSNGQYSFDVTQVEIASGQSVTPNITFSPTGLGFTPEVLIVNAEGQMITYNLNAFSDGVGGQFSTPSGIIDNGSLLFVNQVSCAGAGIVSLPVEVRNIGSMPFEVSRLDVFRTDTVVKQGQPRYSLMRDGANQVMSANDYFLSADRPLPPFSDDVLRLPFTVNPGETRTIYLTFVSQQPGKRFARAFLYTNDEIVAGTDPNGQAVQGLRVFDLFGRGTGAQFSGSATGGKVGSLVFPMSDVGIQATASRSIFNSGTCDLMIVANDLRITGGDVDEFTVVSAPQPDSLGNIVIKPGESAEIVFGFTPRQVGSRRATVRLRTNDSTIHVPGITERGTYYLNLFGGGASGLYLSDINFGQALIGGDASEQRRDVIRIINSNPSAITISAMSLEGMDAAEFVQDPAHPWPNLPFKLMPGEEIELDVVFAPAASGTPGARSASFSITSSIGTTAVAQLTGEAGTRMVEVNPPAINFASMTAGKFQRRIVTITNSGTMPLRITQPEVTGPDATSFQVSNLPRLEIEPGGSEYLEVTYAPTAPGTVAATLMMGGNATNAPVQVSLSGTGFMPKGPDGNDGMTPVTSIENGVGRSENLNVSGVDMAGEASGLMLSQSIPNPARESVQITFGLAQTGHVELALYNAAGARVRVLEDGVRSAGTHELRVNIGDLPAGVYHYRLASGSSTLMRVLHIVR